MKRISVLLLSVLFLSTCYNKHADLKELTPKRTLKLVEKFKLKVPEPSGLTYSSKDNLLWTVSDETSHAYLITTKGKVLDSIEVDAKDLEGISYMPSGNLAVLSERSGEVVIISPEGKEFNRHNLNIFGEKNKGAEGITYLPANRNYFLIKEKKPKTLFKFDSNFKRIDSIPINFSKDVSGLFCDTTRNELWVISDESQLVVCCDLNGNPGEKYFVDIPQIEGIAIDIENSILYLVSDKTEYLYVYKMDETFRLK